MAQTQQETVQDQRVVGKILQFSWTDGPTKGEIHEHSFHDDGTVEWRGVGKAAAAKPDAEGVATPEKAHYAAMPVSSDVALVSYLSRSGFTLTIAINFATAAIFAIASNNTQWVPTRGTVEVMS